MSWRSRGRGVSGSGGGCSDRFSRQLWPHLVLLAMAAWAGMAWSQSVPSSSSSPSSSVSAQEELFREASFSQFQSQKTGEVYNVSVVGTAASAVLAVRLRTGSLRRYGSKIGEFSLPVGSVVLTSAVRVLLVYFKIGNSSSFSSSSSSYPAPPGMAVYRLVGPALGLLAYDATNFSGAGPFPPLNTSTGTANYTVTIPLFPQLTTPANLSAVRCVRFDSATNTTVSVMTTNLTTVSGICTSRGLGVFYLLEEGAEEVPSNTRSSVNWAAIIGATVAGALVLVVLATLLAILWIRRRRRRKLSELHHQSERGETLRTTTIRNTRTPAAASTRTRPTLENEYALS